MPGRRGHAAILVAIGSSSTRRANVRFGILPTPRAQAESGSAMGVCFSRAKAARDEPRSREKENGPRPQAESQTQSRGTRYSPSRASAEPAWGAYAYSKRTRGGSDIRIDSVRPPDCRPNRVPRS